MRPRARIQNPFPPDPQTFNHITSLKQNLKHIPHQHRATLVIEKLLLFFSCGLALSAKTTLRHRHGSVSPREQQSNTEKGREPGPVFTQGTSQSGGGWDGSQPSRVRGQARVPNAHEPVSAQVPCNRNYKKGPGSAKDSFYPPGPLSDHLNSELRLLTTFLPFSTYLNEMPAITNNCVSCRVLYTFAFLKDPVFNVVDKLF